MAACERSAGRRRQRGDALLESLVAMLLLVVIGLGLVYATGRSMVAQKTQRALGLAVQVLRADLQSSGVAAACGDSGTRTSAGSLSLGVGLPEAALTRTCQVATVKVTLNGVDHTAVLPQVRYEMAAETLLGPGTLTVGN